MRMLLPAGIVAAALLIIIVGALLMYAGVP
jgi:hypothetical protein